jgi:hypothetical protein
MHRSCVTLDAVFCVSLRCSGLIAVPVLIESSHRNLEGLLKSADR